MKTIKFGKNPYPLPKMGCRGTCKTCGSIFELDGRDVFNTTRGKKGEQIHSLPCTMCGEPISDWKAPADA